MIVARVTVLLSCLAVAGAAHAATLVVNNLEDRISANSCTLRTALKAINEGMNTGGCINQSVRPYGTNDTINFEAGQAGTITLLEGQLEILNPLRLNGPGQEVLTVTKPADVGDINDLHRIIYIEHVGSTLISGLTIRGGQPLGNGGGILSRADLLEVRDSTVTANRASAGAGIALLAGSSLRLVRSVVSNNRANHGSDGPAPNYRIGGGILAREGDVEVIDSQVIGNSSHSSRAAAAGIMVEAGSLLLEDSVVAHNFGQGTESTPISKHGRGGGIHVTGDATVTRSRISSNSLEGYNNHGGGMFVTAGCLFMQDSEVRQNVTGLGLSSGGGLYLGGSCANIIVDSVIANNVSIGGESNGGGIYAGSTQGLLILLRSSVVDNWADANMGDGSPSHGGGIRAFGPTTLINSTVARNQVFFASRGGGLFVTRNLTLVHFTVATNSAFDHEGGDDIDFAVDDDYSFTAHGTLFVREPVLNPFTLEMDTGLSCALPIIEGNMNLATDSTCGTATLIGQTPVAVEALAVQPLGPTGEGNPVRALGAGSIAIDAAGDCVADHGINDDQRGMPRPAPGSTACDVGAYEVQEGEALGEFVFADGFEG